MSTCESSRRGLGFELDEPVDTGRHDDEFDATGVYHYIAGNYLDDNIDFVLSERVPRLQAEDGVWHPSGFMVFRLGKHATLGVLRLHVWPEGFRNREVRGRGNLGDIWDGDIHDHSWYVDGFNITGYRDKLYEVTTARLGGQFLYSPEEIMQHGFLRQFNAVYLENGQERLQDDRERLRFKLHPDLNIDDKGLLWGRGYRARETEQRVFGTGDLHSIDPGVYHAPAIPDDEFAATLAFNSYRVLNTGPNIMIGGSANEYTRPRQSITEGEWDAAKTSLRKCTL
jgi:hypothetical protein